jgi:SAM-dependent methyltransferase
LTSLPDLRQSWNLIAGEYLQSRPQVRGISYGRLSPGEEQLRILGDVAGQRVLDLGCGGGQNAVAFWHAGACCVGVDLSDAQIEFAGMLAEREEAQIELMASDIRSYLRGQQDSAFDFIFSAQALQYVEDLDDVCRQVARLLRPGGRFVFSLDHPLSEITEMSGQAVLVSRSYFDTGRQEWEWERSRTGERIPFYSYRRTLGEIVSALSSAGLHIEQLVEPEPVDEDAVLNQSERERFSRVAAVMIWVARRP